MFRNIEFIFRETNSNTIYITKIKFINSCNMVYEEDAFDEDARICVIISPKMVLIKNWGEEKVYDIVNINNRLFIKDSIKRREDIVEKIKFKNSIWRKKEEIYNNYDLILSGFDINIENINYYINKIYGKPYNHESLELPTEKQNLSDLWLINEKEILGDIESCDILLNENANDDYVPEQCYESYDQLSSKGINCWRIQ